MLQHCWRYVSPEPRVAEGKRAEAPGLSASQVPNGPWTSAQGGAQSHWGQTFHGPWCLGTWSPHCIHLKNVRWYSCPPAHGFNKLEEVGLCSVADNPFLFLPQPSPAGQGWRVRVSEQKPKHLCISFLYGEFPSLCCLRKSPGSLQGFCPAGSRGRPSWEAGAGGMAGWSTWGRAQTGSAFPGPVLVCLKGYFTHGASPWLSPQAAASRLYQNSRVPTSGHTDGALSRDV